MPIKIDSIITTEKTCIKWIPHLLNNIPHSLFRSRTTIISILSGINVVVSPVAEFVGGQIYKSGGYVPVYLASLTITTMGFIFVILIIPESSKECNKINCKHKTITHSDTDVATAEQKEKYLPASCTSNKSVLWRNVAQLFLKANQSVIEAYR